MTQHTEGRFWPNRSWLEAVGWLALALVPGCGSAIASGGAAAKVGRDLSTHAEGVPRGTALCMIQESLKPPTGAEKPLSKACAKAARSDRLWQRALVVLGAHADYMAGVASNERTENAGRLEAALTGVSGTGWVETDDPSEQAAREAIAQLVNQMSQSEKPDLESVVTNAAPQVKTLCEGLGAHLDALSRDIAAAEREIEKKRAGHADRRCAMLDKRPICVSESVVDRLVYADVLGDLASMQRGHLEARDALARFCAAHRKLEESAAAGNLKKSKTYLDVVDAVSAVQPAQPPTDSAAKSGAESTSDSSGKSPAGAASTTPSSSTGAPR
jgi:hypothetical protein